uniref:Uncharacterized protein n=1 Tax=Anguilla anguilla TaxID=7936 RepID=A0A0E9WQY5_ANGAN
MNYQISTLVLPLANGRKCHRQRCLPILTITTTKDVTLNSKVLQICTFLCDRR